MQQFEVNAVQEVTKRQLLYANDFRDAITRFKKNSPLFKVKTVTNPFDGTEMTVCGWCEACEKVLFEEDADKADSPDRLEHDCEGVPLCGACYSKLLDDTLSEMNISLAPEYEGDMKP